MLRWSQRLLDSGGGSDHGASSRFQRRQQTTALRTRAACNRRYLTAAMPQQCRCQRSGYADGCCARETASERACCRIEGLCSWSMQGQAPMDGDAAASSEASVRPRRVAKLRSYILRSVLDKKGNQRADLHTLQGQDPTGLGSDLSSATGAPALALGHLCGVWNRGPPDHPALPTLDWPWLFCGACPSAGRFTE